MASSAAADLELMRASMLLEADPAAAARRAAVILDALPTHDGAQLLLATACRRLGVSDRAIDVIEALAQAHMGSALIQLEAGRTLAAAGRHPAARAAFERALAVDPYLLEAWRDVAAERLATGDIVAADAAYAEFERMSPVPPMLKDAYVALDANRLDVAEAAVRALLAQGPDDVAALRVLAAVAAQRGDDALTEATLLRVLELAPCSVPAREQVIDLLLQRQRNQQALAHIERLLAGAPARGAWLLLKAETLRLLGRHAEGLHLVTELVEREPRNAQYRLAAGHQLRFGGDAAGAVAAYRAAVALQPTCGEAYWALANLKTLRFTDPEVEAMRRAAPTANDADAIYLEFALGKAREDQGAYADAFAHYAAGNTRVRAGLDYDARATVEFGRRFKAAFISRFFAERTGWGNPAVDPIFIVGLPRSGSTLLEQILSSHSQVEGTRELSSVPIMARELAPRSAGGQSAYPAMVAALASNDIARLANRYLVEARAQRRLDRPYFIDKMLGNFVSIPLIHLMFPQARIIDCRRHPMATGFACYKQLFNRGMNFAYDLREIGSYIHEYADLMGHVDAMLPGRVYRVQYESLVANTEDEVAKLLAHCDLAYDPRCLKFFENRRVAQTISSEQVRQPIYADAIDQWRNFAGWLMPLEVGLAERSPR